MSTNQQKQNEEEVDLGSLFVIIGRGFRNFFNFIGSIFKGVFHFFIIVLIFLKTNIVKIAIAALIGGIIGAFLEFKKDDAYGSEIFLQHNFESTRQLYNNVNFYNDLVKQKDTVSLEKTFGISKEYAASLKKFSIEPVKKENDIINSYNDFILDVDTTTVKSYTFQEFKNSFTDYDYKVHKINVLASKNDVFNKLDEEIISSVVKNKYFNRVKTLTNENLNRTDSVLRQNLGQIDSLRKVYMKVMLDEAKKETSGTNIDLGGDKTTTKELELFETNNKINKNLKIIAEDKAEKYEVINVISNFQTIGYEVKGIQKNYIFLLAFVFAILTILFVLFQDLNKYLNNYKK
jgi:hypothetical protein